MLGNSGEVLQALVYLSQWNSGSGCCQFCLSPCIRFQEINYGSIIKKKKKKKRKKSNIHHLFHSPTVTGLLWRIEVSNLSGGLEVSRGDLPCRRCLCMRGVFSCQGCISCSDTHTHTHTHTHTRTRIHIHTHIHTRTPSLSLSFEVLRHCWHPNHIHLRYPSVHCVKRPRRTWHKLLQLWCVCCVLLLLWFELYSGNLHWLCVVTASCLKSLSRGAERPGKSWIFFCEHFENFKEFFSRLQSAFPAVLSFPE